MFVVHAISMDADDNDAGLPSIEPRTALILARPVMWNVADATKVITLDNLLIWPILIIFNLVGHFAKDCPQANAPRTCRNCG